MSTILELTFTLEPEGLEGGYTRYASSDLPGFRILCEPGENPIPLIERAAHKFFPAFIAAAMRPRPGVRREVPRFGPPAPQEKP